MRWVRVAAIGFALAGCASPGGGGGGKMAWMRTDGRPVDAAFEAAMDRCRDEAQGVGAGAARKQREETMKAAMQGCMQRRGYVWRCQHPLGVLAPGACTEDEASPDKGAGPPGPRRPASL